jgi:hypothetical protein
MKYIIRLREAGRQAGREAMTAQRYQAKLPTGRPPMVDGGYPGSRGGQQTSDAGLAEAGDHHLGHGVASRDGGRGAARPLVAPLRAAPATPEACMVLPVPADPRRRVSAETACEIAHNARKPPSLMR